MLVNVIMKQVSPLVNGAVVACQFVFWVTVLLEYVHCFLARYPQSPEWNSLTKSPSQNGLFVLTGR